MYTNNIRHLENIYISQLLQIFLVIHVNNNENINVKMLKMIQLNQVKMIKEETIVANKVAQMRRNV